jgi:hypothetical protein
MNKEEPKKYNIDSFKKLCNVVNLENSSRLAIDLGQWLIYYAVVTDEIRKKHPKETKNKSNSQIAECTFTWVDDGKNDLLHATVENKNTGEITEVKIQAQNTENPNHEPR